MSNILKNINEIKLQVLLTYKDLKKFSNRMMKSKRLSFQRGLESSLPCRTDDALPDVALAAIISSSRQRDVNEFINFILEALERNATWLNAAVAKQPNFKCVLMVGAGPNRFQLQEVIYPAAENEVKLEVELKDSADYDKIAIAALLKLTNSELMRILDFVKTRLYDNAALGEDLIRGKSLGISYAALKPFSEKQYRLTERIVLDSSVLRVFPSKRKREDKVVTLPTKKYKKRS